MDSNVRIIMNSKYRMLCFSNQYSLYCHGNTLYSQKAGTNKYFVISKIPVGFWKEKASILRPLSRLVRLEPRCGIFINDHNALISCFGSIYRVNLIKGVIVEEHKYRKGMGNPLSFSKICGIHGFNDCVMYGEYINDGKENEISVFSRGLDSSVWEIVYTFPKGSVKHIHAIIPCKQRNSILVLTGDSDNESGIWEATDGFKSIRKIVGGKQKYRTCLALPIDTGILYASDAPDEQNALWYCNYEGTAVEKIKDLAGPCIYGAYISENRMIISTSVEPTSYDERLISWVTYKRGQGVHDAYSHVYIVDSKRTVSEVYRKRKDLLPMRLFGYGTFLFPKGNGDRIFVTGQSLFHCDGKTFELFEPEEN